VYLFVQLFQTFSSILSRVLHPFYNFLESFADFCCLLPISPKNPVNLGNQATTSLTHNPYIQPKSKKIKKH